MHILCSVKLSLLLNLGDFPPFWKSGILGLVDHFVVCTKIFLEVIGPYKNVKQEFSLDSKIFTGLYYRAWITRDKVVNLQPNPLTQLSVAFPQYCGENQLTGFYVVVSLTINKLRKPFGDFCKIFFGSLSFPVLKKQKKWECFHTPLQYPIKHDDLQRRI